jgi:hypothetical protein
VLTACLALLGATALTAAAQAASAASAVSATAAPAAAVPRLDHVFLIMEENNGFHDVIGNAAAPNLNALAGAFGLQANYFGVSPCCSESNYVQLLGGKAFPSVNSDDAYWKNRIEGAPSLITQLDKAHVSWKAYLQSLPYAGYEGICYPATCNGAPDTDPLYVSKHDGIQNFAASRNAADWSRQVPAGDLARDLAAGDVPRFGYIVPDECHDMHGDPPYCIDSGNPLDPQNQRLVSVGDAYLGHLVAAITGASFWAKGNNAIIITFDEGDDAAGCCDANPGAGQVATVVVTSHGPRHATDGTAANHYSTLASIEQALGLPCLNDACDTANVKPLAKLLAVTGSPAIATTVSPQLTWPTPTPSQPAEPLSLTSPKAGANGWTLGQAQLLGTNDNSLGAIAGSGPSDIWAVGNYLPDDSNSNQDATLTFAEHYDGTSWKVVRTPNAGPNFNSFYGLAAAGGQAWAVGVRLNSAYADRALVEHWDGHQWSVAGTPQPGSRRDLLLGASASSASDVWAVGEQEGTDGRFETLAEHWDGHQWTVVPTPDPGTAGNHLHGVYAVSPDNAWAVGQSQYGPGMRDQMLVEHWDGHSWSQVPTPVTVTGDALLDGVTVAPDGQVWAAGELDQTSGGRPLIARLAGGQWHTLTAVPTLAACANWDNLYGVTVLAGSVYVAGTCVDTVTDNNDPLVLRGTPDGNWVSAGAPAPGSGSNLPGAITAIGGHLWLAGVYDDGGSRLPLIERR